MTGADPLRPVSECAAGVWVKDLDLTAIEIAGSRGEPAWLRLDRLVVDRRYQRDIGRAGTKTVRKIVTGFDWAKFSPLIVAPAVGGAAQYAILDGQHRAAAAHILGLEHVPCMVHQLDLPNQARVFRDVNAVVTRVSKLELHRAGVRAGQPDAVAIDALCRATGIFILGTNRAMNLMEPHETVAVAMIGKVLRRHGFETARRALAVLVAAGADGGTSLLGAWNIRIVAAALDGLPASASGDLCAVALLSRHDLESRLSAARGTAPPGQAPDQVAGWLAGEIARQAAAA